MEDRQKRFQWEISFVFWRAASVSYTHLVVYKRQAYVKSYGYINDARYARTYISFRMESKSRQKILSELQMKGVDRQTALEAWEEMEELMEPDERAVLRKTIEKKYAPDTELDEGQMRRLYGYLARRAFKYEDISHILEEMNIRVKHEME